MPKTGLQKTMELLASTKNEAATRALIAALDSAGVEVQNAAIRALVKRRSSSGHRELLVRWNSFSDSRKALIAEHGGRMGGAIRDAILSTRRELAENGLDAVVRAREYDLIPVLINAAEDRTNALANQAGQALVKLSETLCEELSGPRDYRSRRDPQMIRQYVLAALDQSMQRFEKHHREEIMEAFLLLVNVDSSTLRKILENPLGPAYRAVTKALAQSPRPGIQRVLLNYLDDRRCPTTVHSIVCRREDIPFVRRFLHKLSGGAGKFLRNNLKKIESVGWLGDDMSVLRALSGSEQCGVIEFVLSANINRLAAFKVIQFLMLHGEVEARRRGAEVICDYHGVEANDLIVECLNDDDPTVQATLVGQLRERGIAGTMHRLIELVESPHEEVRASARHSLSEFTFERFIANFELMDDAMARSTGLLVKRIDETALEQLKAELSRPSRTRRLRAVAMARAMGVVPKIETELHDMLRDDDHFLRAEIARALAACETQETMLALRELLLDRSPTVREAAEQSMQQIAITHVPPPPADPPVPPLDQEIPS